ncbi:MAG: uraH [Bacteroidota bacterium]|nr:uraH [Bacteroidota bacterium]
MSQITTHILDTSKGSPAKGVNVVLYQQHGDNWNEVGKGMTNEDGRISDLFTKETELVTGIYKLHFDTKRYFDETSVESFYPFVEIVFEIKNDRHYHVPLLLNPFGYSTYRGS